MNETINRLDGVSAPTTPESETVGKSKSITVTQPEEWVAAWKKHVATSKGRYASLSDFIGSACNAQLPESVLKKLPEKRPAAHRPPANDQ